MTAVSSCIPPVDLCTPTADCCVLFSVPTVDCCFLDWNVEAEEACCDEPLACEVVLEVFSAAPASRMHVGMAIVEGALERSVK